MTLLTEQEISDIDTETGMDSSEGVSMCNYYYEKKLITAQAAKTKRETLEACIEMVKGVTQSYEGIPNIEWFFDEMGELVAHFESMRGE